MTNKSLQTLLPFFDPNELPDFPFIFVCSARRAGKSVLVTSLLLNHFYDKYDFIIGLCGNPSTAQDYIRSGAIPAKYCHSRYREDFLKKWFEKSEELLSQGKKLPRVLFVCDDILVTHSVKDYNRTTRSSPWLSKLATQGRHFSAGCILIVQSWGGSGALGYVRNSDCCIVSPSSLYAGNDFQNLAKLFMTGDCCKLNREILDLFQKYDFLVLRYWHATRDQKKLLSWYRVNKQSLDFASNKANARDLLLTGDGGVDNSSELGSGGGEL